MLIDRSSRFLRGKDPSQYITNTKQQVLTKRYQILLDADLVYLNKEEQVRFLQHLEEDIQDRLEVLSAIE